MKKVKNNFKNRKTKILVIVKIISGSFIGFINGFLGGGGGMLCVPALEEFFNLPNKNAHSTALIVMLPLSIISGIVYILNNNINFEMLGLVMIGSITGSILGALLLKRLNYQYIRFIFSVVLMLAGIKMIIG